MKMNVGKVDRIFRIILGLGGLLAGYVNNSTLWYALGAIAVLSGFWGFCPIYALFGTGTRKSYLDLSPRRDSTDQTIY